MVILHLFWSGVREVFLAVVEVRGFEIGPKKNPRFYSCLSMDEVDNLKAPATAICQVLDIRSSDANIDHWEWNGDYIQVARQKAKEKFTHHHFTLRVPGQLLEPLKVSTCFRPTHRQKVTWVFDRAVLGAAFEVAWGESNENGSDIVAKFDTLPEITHAEACLPYMDQHGKLSLPIEFQH